MTDAHPRLSIPRIVPYRFKLRFSPQQIQDLANRYNYPGENRVVEHLAPRIRKRGYLNTFDFLELCKWKTSRTKKRCAENSGELIEAVTRIALTTPCRELQIKILLALRGVSWPTASVILHFGCDNLYPILDYRALWSVGIEAPQSYNFELWDAYTKFCRDLAHRHQVTLRVLDRALWQYSKEKQP